MPRAVKMASWRTEIPVETAVSDFSVCGALAVAPPASMALLTSADLAVLRAALTPWAQAGHMTEGIGSGLSARRAHVAVPPGCMHARFWLTRSITTPLTVAGEASTIKGTTAGGFASGDSVVIVPPPLYGTDVYLGTAGTAPIWTIVHPSGGNLQPMPATPQNRALELPESLAGAVELVEIEHCCGWGVGLLHRTADVESL